MEQTVKTKRITQPRNRALAFLCAVLAAFLVCSWGMWAAATDFGYVDIQRIEMVGDDGLTYSALMMIPENATNDNPAPAFIPLHGGSGDARVMDTWGIELARRGYVVMIPDTAGGGASEKYTGNPEDTNAYITQPVDTMFQYLLTCNFVDTSDISIAGISQGTNSVCYLGTTYPEYIKTACLIAGPAMGIGTYEFQSNLLVMVGEKDTVMMKGENGTFVDGTYGDLYEQFSEFGITANDQIELDKVYGDFAQETARQFKMNRMTHAAGTFNFECISAITDFIMQGTGYENVPNYIAADEATWHIREALGFVDAVLFIVFICALGNVFLESNYFQNIKRNRAQNLGLRGKEWAVSAVLAIIAPIVIYVIWGGKRQSNAIWPAYHLNKSMLWLALLTVFGLFMFVVAYHFGYARKKGGNLAQYGLTYENQKGLSLALIGRSLVFALLVAFVGTFLLGVLETCTGLTPHCWAINYSPLVPNRMQYVPAYWIIYLVAFLMSGLGMNVERRLPETGKESVDTAIAVVVNIALGAGGMGILLLVQWIFGYNAMTEPGVYTQLANLADHSQFAMPFTIGAACGINTYFYRKSGSVWPGAMVAATVIALNALMNNSL